MNISLDKIAPPVAFVLVGFIMIVIGATGTIPFGNPQSSITDSMSKGALLLVGVLLIAMGPVLVWREQTSLRQTPERSSELSSSTTKPNIAPDPDKVTVELANRAYIDSLDSLLRKAQKEIILYAVHHSTIVHHGLGLLREKVEAGCEVKILLMAAQSADGKVNPNVLETESHRTYDVGLLSRIESNTQSFQTWLNTLSEAARKKIEIRAYQQCPINTFVIIDRDEPNGFVQTEVLLYGLVVRNKPHYKLTKKDGENLFKAHCESFDQLWNRAEILHLTNKLDA